MFFGLFSEMAGAQAERPVRGDVVTHMDDFERVGCSQFCTLRPLTAEGLFFVVDKSRRSSPGAQGRSPLGSAFGLLLLQ